MPGCETNFFKVNRKIFESDIWLHPDKLRIFLYLLGQARWKSTPNTKYKNYGIVIDRGQYLRSLRKLQGDLEYFYNNALKEYSLSTLSRIISQLEEEERITTEKTELGTLFTVCNYHKYQKVSGDKEGLGTDLEQARNAVGTPLEQYSKKGERKMEEEKQQVPYQKIANLYNDIAEKLPNIRKVNDQRKRHLKARWNEEGNIDVFEEVFEIAENTPFLTGDNERNWTADFDWIIKNNSNFNKILEGKYGNCTTEEECLNTVDYDDVEEYINEQGGY